MTPLGVPPVQLGLGADKRPDSNLGSQSSRALRYILSQTENLQSLISGMFACRVLEHELLCFNNKFYPYSREQASKTLGRKGDGKEQEVRTWSRACRAGLAVCLVLGVTYKRRPVLLKRPTLAVSRSQSVPELSRPKESWERGCAHVQARDLGRSSTC